MPSDARPTTRPTATNPIQRRLRAAPPDSLLISSPHSIVLPPFSAMQSEFRRFCTGPEEKPGSCWGWDPRVAILTSDLHLVMPSPPAPPAPNFDPLLGATIDDRWRVIARVGSGGMGIVYRAERLKLGKQVALKVLHDGLARSKDFVARFEREARAISRLEHIHCVSILDFGVHARRPYIVMEFVAGRRLTEEIRSPQLTTARAVGLIRQVLIGLRHAHEQGVLHRDLKPDNIMLTEVTGTGDLVKILDFGFAHMVDSQEPTLTERHIVAGTPSYMSPEQASGTKTDLRTDIYSTGVMLYELCVGKKPFQSDDVMQVLAMHLHQPPPPPRQAAPRRRISPALERVILRALSKDRDARFEDARAFLQALDATPEGHDASRPKLSTTGAHAQPSVEATPALEVSTGQVIAERSDGAARPPRPSPRRSGGRRAVFSLLLLGVAAAAVLVARARILISDQPAGGAGAARPDGVERGAGPAAPSPAATAPAGSLSPDAGTQSAPAGSPPPGSSVDAPSAAPAAPTAEPLAALTGTPSAPAAPAPTPPAATPGEPPGPAGREVVVDAQPAPAAAEQPSVPEPAGPGTEAAEPETPAAAKPVAGQRAPEPKAEAERLLVQNKLNEAERLLVRERRARPEVAWIHQQLAEIYFRRLWRRDAIREWDDALRLEPSLRRQRALQQELCAALDPHWNGDAERLLTARFGPAAVAPMRDCIRTTKDREVLRAAVRVTEQVAPNRVDKGLVATRELELAGTCEDRRAAVQRIGELRERRAIEMLVKLERARVDKNGRPLPQHACLGTAVRDTLARLR